MMEKLSCLPVLSDNIPGQSISFSPWCLSMLSFWAAVSFLWTGFEPAYLINFISRIKENDVNRLKIIKNLPNMPPPTHRNCRNTEWSVGLVFGCMGHSEGEVGRAEHSLLSSLSQTPLLKLPSYHHKVLGEWSAAVRIRNFPSWSTELPFEFHLLSAGLSWTCCLESQSPPSFIHKTKPFPAPIGVVALGKALEDSSHTWSRVYWNIQNASVSGM